MLRKGSIEIYIHSVNRGARGKRKRRRDFNPQEGPMSLSSREFTVQHGSLSSKSLSHPCAAKCGKAPTLTGSGGT